jgi:hypothetical protein
LNITVTDELILLPPVRRDERAEGGGLPHKRSGRATKRPQLSRRPSRLNTAARAVIVVVVVVLAGLIWVGVRGGMAANASVVGASAASNLQSQLEGSTTMSAAEIDDAIDTVQHSAASAKQLTSDVVWRAMEFFPFLGSNLSTARQSFDALDVVASDALAPLVDLSSVVGRDALSGGPSPDRLAKLALGADDLGTVDNALQAGAQRIASVDTTFNLPIVSETFTSLRSTVREGAAVSSGLRAISAFLPARATSPEQRWVAMVTNESDPRAKGPIAYLSMSTAGTRAVSEIVASDVLFPAVKGESRKHGSPTVDAVAAAMAKHTGVEVTKVISIDLLAIKFLLEASGPVQLAGAGEISADTAMDFASTGAYAQAASHADAQLWIGTLASDVLGRLVG